MKYHLFSRDRRTPEAEIFGLRGPLRDKKAKPTV